MKKIFTVAIAPKNGIRKVRRLKWKVEPISKILADIRAKNPQRSNDD